MALSKAEQRTIRNLIKRLKKQDCGCYHTTTLHGDPTREELDRMNAMGQEVVSRIYLDTWVIGSLEALLRGDPRLAEGLSAP